MDEREIRLRCIEAAAKTPTAHPQGQAVGVQAIASCWFDWVNSGAADLNVVKPPQEIQPIVSGKDPSFGDKMRNTLGLPRK